MPRGQTPEELEKQKEDQRYHDELVAQWLEISEAEMRPPADLRKSEPEVAEFRAMASAFEATHSLAELLLITDLTRAEAEVHPVREPARIDVGKIAAKLAILKKETNISAEEYEELNVEYHRFSRAVGTINKGGKVDHAI